MNNPGNQAYKDAKKLETQKNVEDVIIELLDEGFIVSKKLLKERTGYSYETLKKKHVDEIYMKYSILHYSPTSKKAKELQAKNLEQRFSQLSKEHKKTASKYERLERKHKELIIKYKKLSNDNTDLKEKYELLIGYVHEIIDYCDVQDYKISSVRQKYEKHLS
jgi:vacuolar-type H+-ATPase subunit I/STV1